MNQNSLLIGGIALVGGILLGLLFAPRGASVDEIERMMQERLAAVETRLDDGMTAVQSRLDETVTSVQTGMEETASSLESRFGELGDRIGSVETAVGETSQNQATMAETLRTELSDRMSSLGSAISQQSQDLQTGLAGFRRSLAMDDVGSESSGENGEQAESGDAGASSQPATQPAAPDEDFVGTGVGQTESFGDGALRVFVSRVDPQANAARLSVNGATTAMKVGDTVGVTSGDGTYCRLMLSGLQGSQVSLNAACGDDLPAAEGIRPGGVMLLADGAIRVFVSGIADGGGAARIAVNGVSTEMVDVGQSVDVAVEDQNCRVTVDEIDRGHVALSSSCG